MTKDNDFILTRIIREKERYMSDFSTPATDVAMSPKTFKEFRDSYDEYTKGMSPTPTVGSYIYGLKISKSSSVQDLIVFGRAELSDLCGVKPKETTLQEKLDIIIREIKNLRSSIEKK